MTTVNERIIIHIQRLLDEKHFPKKSILLEHLLDSGKRADVATIDNHNKPLTISEVKEKLPEKLEDAKNQLTGLSKEFGNRFAIATDGYVDFCYEVINKSGGIYLKEIPDIPNFSSSLENIGRHSNHELITTK